MMAEPFKTEVLLGIDNPSDAILPWGKTLYRTSHAQRRNRVTGVMETNGPDAGYQANWWSLSDEFLAETWFSGNSDYSSAARKAYAIHPAWRSDCSNFTCMIPQCDLSVWYGLGKLIDLPDPDTGKQLKMPASSNVLQIYIPGFGNNYAKWARLGGTVPFK